jgi:hypothetical protein
VHAENLSHRIKEAEVQEKPEMGFWQGSSYISTRRQRGQAIALEGGVTAIKEKRFPIVAGVAQVVEKHVLVVSLKKDQLTLPTVL